MQNVASHISSHNKKILKNTDGSSNNCNCRNKNLCPLPGRCQTPAVVYQGEITVENDNESYNYMGHTEPVCKERFSDHNTSFTYENYRTKTDLSKKWWELKDAGKVPHITWSIVRRSSPYESGSDHCNLCLWEKFHIMKGRDLLNSKDELVSYCKHVDKFLLKNFKARNR